MRRPVNRFSLSLVVAAAAASAVLPARAAPTSKSGDAVVLDRVVARIDADTILQSDLLERARPLLAKGGDRHAVLQQVLSQMIDDDLIARDAARRQVVITDAQVQQAIDQVRKNSSLTKAQLDALLRKQGVTRRAYEDEIRRQLLEYKWLLVRIGTKAKPGDPKAYESFVVQAREAAVAELRRGAFIEVRL
jgi:peptidyl-prolyl cis-trans isomerase SurA